MSVTKKRKWWRIGLVTLAFILVISLGYVLYLYNHTKDMLHDSHEELDREESKSKLRESHVNPVEDNVSVLILGVDTSEHRGYEEQSRTDAIILATFNKEENSINLLSIPRDTYVYVPVVGYHTKINHAHFYGGPEATIETIEDLLQVPIDYYVRMNFEGFVEVVDALNGIMYDVPYEILESDSQDKKNSIHLKPGYQRVNGEEALALARTRKYDNDIQRGERQQEIVKEIIAKATSVGSVLKIDNVINAIGNNMKTNISFDHAKSFLAYALNENIHINTINFDGEGRFTDTGWYYFVNDESKLKVQEGLREHLNLE